MQDTLRGIISDFHVFLYGGLQSLPFSLGGTMLLLGLFTSNYAILFFLIGFLVAVPLATWVVNRFIPLLWNSLKFIGYIIAYLYDNKTTAVKPTDWLEIPESMAVVDGTCKLVIPYLSKNDGKPETVISSEWMGMVSFFIGYVICNSLQLYNADISNSASLSSPDASDTQAKVQKRRGQAMISLISICLFALIAISFRFYTGCKPNRLGMLFTAAGFGAAGYYWYDLLSRVGQGRLSDIFGIANRLLAPSAIKNGPIACVPIPSS